MLRFLHPGPARLRQQTSLDHTHLVVQEARDGVAVGTVAPAHPALVLLHLRAEHVVAPDREALALHADPARPVAHVARGPVHDLQFKEERLAGPGGLISLFFVQSWSGKVRSAACVASIVLWKFCSIFELV